VINTTATTTVLLEGLHDSANEAAWTHFDQRYRPIVVAFARRLGLNDTDAADVAQETLTRFVEEYRAGKYDRTRGRLRSWLIGLAKYRVSSVYRARHRAREFGGVSQAADLTDEHELETIWEAERRASMLREAMEQLRSATRSEDKTIRAFELLVLNQTPPATVADQLQMTTQDVYRAKNRIAQRLQSIVDRLEAAYDDQ